MHLLFESAPGLAIFSVRDFDDVAKFTREVQDSIADAGAFASLVKLVAFQAFAGNDESAAFYRVLDEGVAPETLIAFIRSVGCPSIMVVDERLRISLQGHGIIAEYGPAAIELSRGVRRHYAKLMGAEVTSEQLSATTLGLAHLIARNTVSFDKHRADSMAIQGVGHYETVTKNANTFFMRLSEWYSYHFPELRRILGDRHEAYPQVVLAIGRKESLQEPDGEAKRRLYALDGACLDTVTCDKIVAAASVSIGMQLQDADLEAVLSLAKQTMALFTEREALSTYLSEKMAEIAPNTATLMGDIPASRLIARAGGLRSLAKAPASTIQILGAEKALFRALKQRSKRTPKFGIIFSSPQVSRVDIRKKGTVARNLACYIARASKMDCFGMTRDNTFGLTLRDLLEERIAFYRAGRGATQKTMEAMHKLFPNGTSYRTDSVTETKTDSISTPASKTQASELPSRGEKEEKRERHDKKEKRKKKHE
ncbi:Nop domain-containing protein [Giardia muris]|uniref:Nucleolar protein 56 n=1 Tax=Giardia muris TaxID=5742 RepID=A0A4Z1SZC4_GIAMU|nr:Nop domain-containing protein [Giardia muris]|eukprot:TNJ28828.1 Nop domain-containing protein [Giardia muris]